MSCEISTDGGQVGQFQPPLPDDELAEECAGTKSNCYARENQQCVGVNGIGQHVVRGAGVLKGSGRSGNCAQAADDHVERDAHDAWG